MGENLFEYVHSVSFGITFIHLSIFHPSVWPVLSFSHKNPKAWFLPWLKEYDLSQAEFRCNILPVKSRMSEYHKLKQIQIINWLFRIQVHWYER